MVISLILIPSLHTTLFQRLSNVHNFHITLENVEITSFASWILANIVLLSSKIISLLIIKYTLGVAMKKVHRLFVIFKIFTDPIISIKVVHFGNSCLDIHDVIF